MRNESTNLPEKSEIQKAVNNYCSLRNISKADLAVRSGISHSVYADLEKGNYETFTNVMLLKIWNFVNRENVANLYKSTDLVCAFKLCDKVRKYHFMAGLVADTGMGKTTAMTTYSRQSCVFYVCYDKTMNPRQFFSALLRELSYPYEGSLNEMINRAADTLNELESPLLIIDEAGKLNQTMILYLHVLRDKIKDNCGVVLAGMPYFKTNMYRQAEAEREGYAEFLRRITFWQSFEGLTRKEVEEICRLNGIGDPDRIKLLRNKKRYGDLMNEINEYKIEMGEL